MRKEPYAIDPLALLLRNDVYVRLTLPDPPPIDLTQVRESLAKMNDIEKKEALNRAKALTHYAAGLEKAIQAEVH
jgi:hypothetical protein